MMVTREFWRDRASGEHWAVELTEGEVTACAGPLRLGDVNLQYLRGLDYSDADAARMQRERDQFEPVTAAELLLLDGV